MNPKRLRFQEVDKTSYRVYFRKASSFHDAMKSAYDSENWNAVGLGAVHCVISAADALLCKKAGLRVVADNHMDLADALAKSIIAPGVEENKKRVSKVIAKKNLIEYEAREFRRRDAEAIMIDADRFFTWAKEHLEA